MRLFLLDSGLRTRGSHNLVFALLVGEEARRRGIEVTAFTHRTFVSEPTDPFAARPLFSASYYDSVDGDPVMQPVLSFRFLNAMFLRELKAIPKKSFRATDVIWVPTISERHLEALFTWIRSFEGDSNAPQFVITLTLPPGIATALGTAFVYDTLQALHYRTLLAGKKFGPNVHFNATGGPIAQDYSFLAKRKIPQHPVLLDPNLALAPVKDRTLLVYAGDAAQRKGILMLPKALSLFGPKLPGWKFLAHVNDAGEWSPKRPGMILRSMHEKLPAVELRTGFHGPDEHRRLFEEASVVLLGYERDPYSRGMSGVLWEAIAAGRPLILPNGTYLQKEAENWGASYATIDTTNAETLAEGVVRVLTNGSLDFEKSYAAARAFRKTNGVPRYVDQLEALSRRDRRVRQAEGTPEPLQDGEVVG